MEKWVYTFGAGKAEGKATMKDLLGGKGANLAEMCNLGLPVPPGFTITTEVCTYFYNKKHTYPASLKSQVEAGIKKAEKIIGKKFGDNQNPLLFSVRSGARISMPGMMDTVLDLGLNDETVKGLAKASGSEHFAYDSYRRFLQMYSDVVLGIHSDHFEAVLEKIKKRKGYMAGQRHRCLGKLSKRRNQPFPASRRSIRIFGIILGQSHRKYRKKPFQKVTFGKRY